MIGDLLTAAVRVATPLALAAIGEMLVARGGMINLGIEGAMLAGALGAAVGASASGVGAGVGLALFAGVATAAVFAAVAVWARGDEIITGTAVTLGMIGLTGIIARQHFGLAGVGLSLPTMAAVPIPGFSRLPVVGEALFDQSLLTYLVYLMLPLSSWLLFRSRFGLELRASGEAASAAAANGVAVRRIRTLAVLFGGAMAGVAGASLVLAQVGTFTEKMTAGRGFIAIAIVILGARRPAGVAAASLLFGGAIAIQYVLQGQGGVVPYQLWLALPYVLALLVLVLSARRRGVGLEGRPSSTAPAA
ncbi:MAG: ABC transporter permease [Gemmatimonadota bacterium]